MPPVILPSCSFHVICSLYLYVHDFFHLYRKANFQSFLRLFSWTLFLVAKSASLLFSSAEEIVVLETVAVLELWRSARTKCFPFPTLLLECKFLGGRVWMLSGLEASLAPPSWRAGLSLCSTKLSASLGCENAAQETPAAAHDSENWRAFWREKVLPEAGPCHSDS